MFLPRSRRSGGAAAPRPPEEWSSQFFTPWEMPKPKCFRSRGMLLQNLKDPAKWMGARLRCKSWRCVGCRDALKAMWFNHLARLITAPCPAVGEAAAAGAEPIPQPILHWEGSIKDFPRLGRRINRQGGSYVCIKGGLEGERITILTTATGLRGAVTIQGVEAVEILAAAIRGIPHAPEASPAENGRRPPWHGVTTSADWAILEARKKGPPEWAVLTKRLNTTIEMKKALGERGLRWNEETGDFPSRLIRSLGFIVPGDWTREQRNELISALTDEPVSENFAGSREFSDTLAAKSVSGGGWRSSTSIGTTVDDRRRSSTTP